ncbi:type I secretion C-terminal target domain (VC_A0849 subclass) [Palleronia pelagia]|uniref:Type I secretion C-terminal target domain (VC_A0849 subclass) n=2 Tax=Palleronia pelagia TaxID=387096 RepID=A0A1H8C2L0_9RHOB|nr:type I secretion C-terminal target domain (VC_A0849 subclass) [Palleronia pelagia]
MAIWENVVFLVVGARGGVNNVTGADITALDTAISNTISGTYYSDVLNSLYGIDDNGLDITGTSSADTIDGAGFEDLLQGQDGDDTINGYNGNDYIATGGGNDTAYGGNGHDEIYNYSGNDTFYGGSGADLITSGTGSDTYVFNVGDGDDTIVESYSTSATDRIQFGSGITLSDLTFTRVSNEDLLITIDPSAGGGSILVDGHFKSYAENINEIVFSDTSTFDPESINYTLHATDNAETQLNGVHTGSDDDTIYGHGGNDRIFGYQGADNLYGGDGDDTIYAYNTSGEYADTHAHILDGGAGNDLIRAADGADDITGGTGNDSLFGYSGNDTYTFNYGDGNDTLEDDAGTADVIELGAGITQADLSYDLSEQYDLKIIIDGGAGGSIFINRMYYSATYQVESLVLADSTVIDLIYQDYEWSGSNGNDYLYGRDFNDSVDTIHGLDGDDYIIGERGDDVLYGDAGDDEIYGDYGDDIIYGGTGADTLRGSYGADELYGGDGNDDIRSGADDDILSGGLGDDYLNGEGGYGDIVDYGTASNGVVVNFQTGTATGEGTDTLSSIEYAHGSSYNDTFSPSYYTKGFDGKGGVDTLDLAAGYGASYYANVNLASGTMSGYYINLTLANIENVIGRSGNDTLTGDAQANQLEGRNGNDTISGADGDDLLYGGSGNDTVTGGNGADTYFFLDGETGSDTITDFSIADGDALNLADMLSLFDPLTDILTDFVEITDSGSNSIVKIDQDGGADSFVQIATLTGVTGLTDEDALEASGNLIAA